MPPPPPPLWGRVPTKIGPCGAERGRAKANSKTSHMKFLKLEQPHGANTVRPRTLSIRPYTEVSDRIVNETFI